MAAALLLLSNLKLVSSGEYSAKQGCFVLVKKKKSDFLSQRFYLLHLFTSLSPFKGRKNFFGDLPRHVQVESTL